MLKIAVLISNIGTGTNLQAIIDAIENKELNSTIEVVVSGSKDAYGLIRAREHKISTCIMEEKEDLSEIFEKKYEVEFIVLAGWKRIISWSFIEKFYNRILNLHPGLIPDTIQGVVKNPDGTDGLWNRGKLADRAIANFISNNATYAGSSVHFLTNEFDFGPVLNRCFEKINKVDTVEVLYNRLKKKENAMYVKTLIQLSHLKR